MTPPRINADALQAQITALAERTDGSLTEIKNMLMALDARLRAIEVAQAGELPMLRVRLDAAWKKIDKHEEQIGKLAESASSTRQLEGIAKWALGIFTAVLIAIIILLATGKATIVFK